MWVAYGVGAAGVVAGSVFGVLAIAKDIDLEDKCPNNDCPGQYEDDMNRLELYANLSTAGFAVGLAGAAVGTYLLLFSGDGKSAPEQAALGVRMGLGSVGVTGRF